MFCCRVVFDAVCVVWGFKKGYERVMIRTHHMKLGGVLMMLNMRNWSTGIQSISKGAYAHISTD